MIRLRFESRGTRASCETALPCVALGVGVRTLPSGAQLRGVALQTLVQIEPAARSYSQGERERLRELFGAETQWPDSLRSVVWTRLSTQLGAFTDNCDFELQLPCGPDLELVASKYCYGIESGEVALRLLFSGSIFHGDAALQITPVGRESELSIRLPLSVLHQAVARHHGEQMLIGLRRDVFERLYRYRRERCLPSWEQVVERLLAEAGAAQEEV